MRYLFEFLHAFVKGHGSGFTGDGFQLFFQLCPALFTHDQLVFAFLTFHIRGYKTVSKYFEVYWLTDAALLPVDRPRIRFLFVGTNPAVRLTSLLPSRKTNLPLALLQGVTTAHKGLAPVGLVLIINLLLVRTFDYINYSRHTQKLQRS